jgi:stage V sporulation protein G
VQVSIENPRVILVRSGNLRAIAWVKIADAFYLSGLRVIEGKRGFFVSMPARRDKQGEMQDIYWPATKEIKDQLEAVVLKRYRQMVGQEAIQ